MIVIDKAKRMAHLIPCSKLVTAQQAAQYYVGSIANFMVSQNLITVTEGDNLLQNLGSNCGDCLGLDLDLVQHFIHRRSESWRE